ncbi:MAG: insulinase family protein [Gammaproteobacteria bacterium]|nr:insulinase family protein [Gammaproteobacteria bacterium]MBP6051646.1 insulinase family protein [Pseudomonadales bacterium]MBK6584656.1 insulinase family protein [Gammaproteobacteria bacterium]MBK7170959.1 insulinase family protein [Gammaproteobacteria bacterium]MBK7519835.1 insulinase family protein [Gammaproteobacteria bacterium]
MQSKLVRHAGLVLVLALLCACATVPRNTGPVIKGELDPREYRYLELPNRMRVILVSDPASDKAAASLQVRAGSGDDPEGRQGLAHFLEHMLFLGTGKYPDPAEYQAFINAHGGSNNAYTSVDHTNYFFDVEPDSLVPALDRFAQFFVAPLFNREYVAREMNAVDSEYKLGLKDDGRREYDVLRELVQPGHPLAKLAVGNLQTLGEGSGDIRADLLGFYEKHYSANLMTLVVLGRESLDELSAMVEARFAAVPDRGAKAREHAPALFAPGTLPLEVHVRPEKELRELSLLFPVPSARAMYGAKPLEYIGNLLGHEGPGSALSLLKERGWAEGLGAGAGFDLYGEDAFQINVQLTEAGIAHYREVAGLVFASIDLLRDQGVAEWRFREQGSLGELDFRFREKGSPTGAVIGIANALQDYPVAEVLRGPYLFRDYDSALIARYLGYLRPDNVLLTLTHPGIATDRVSAWFQTPYSVSRPQLAEVAADVAGRAALTLPKPNEFIPGRLAIKAPGAAVGRPEAVVEQPDYRLWHLQDAQFLAPKASIFFRVLSDTANASARNAALMALYTRLVEDQLNEFAYPATLAGLQYSIAPSSGGFSVRIGGYDDKQVVLLEKILHALREQQFDGTRFEALKTELLRSWGNSVRERPYVQLLDGLGESLVKRNWSDAELQAALAPEDAAALAGLTRQMYQRAALEVLVHGNFGRDEAKRIGSLVYSALRSGTHTPAQPAPVEIVALGRGQQVREFKVDHPDSALLFYLQGGAASYAERARIALSAQIVSAPFFNELRTEKQLGYVVFAQPYPLFRVPGLLLAVQSPGSGPVALTAAVTSFLKHQAQTAADLPQAEFERHRRALVDRLNESAKSLAEQSDRLWADLSLGAYGFDDRARVAAEVERIDRQQWVDYFRANLDGAAGRAMVLYSRGSAQAPGAAQTVPGHAVTGADRWRDDAKYYRFDWSAAVQESPAALHL